MVCAVGGATNGVLIKGGDALEKACSVCCLVFDKTGTLTVGLPCVVDTFRTHPSISKEECAVLAATVESSSEHPLAKAIVSFCVVPSLPPEKTMVVDSRSLSVPQKMLIFVLGLVSLVL